MKNKLGMELTKLGGSDDPLEGSNVTLICRQFSVDSLTPALKWSIIGSNSKELILLNATHPPEGWKEYSIISTPYSNQI